ncbi:MAG: N-methyl-L-tryptophan oxidase [Haloferacaceae archaeon]
MERHDVVVVGMGVVGSATARALARDGYAVLGLERDGIPNPRSSSHGPSRIIRLAYHEGATYVPMLRRSYDRWAALGDRRDERLLRTTGSLAIGPPDSRTFAGARETCRAHDIDHEVLDAEAVNRRFPAYDLPPGLRAVHQPDGALLDAERCLVGLVEAAMADGAEVRAREAVLDWTADGDRVRVRTERGVHVADAVVIAAGAWAADRVPELDGLLTPERHVVCRFRPADPGAFEPASFPVFVADTADGRHFYGLPAHRVPGVKVGDTTAGRLGVDPDALDRRPDPGEERTARAFVERHMPAGAGPTMDLTACLLSHSPDGDYVIDRLPGRPNAVVAVGGSGHGFKTAPVVGELAAALATDREPPVDPAPFALDRFEDRRSAPDG